MAQWLSWLERRPVTAKVESSSLFWVVMWDLSSAGRASALQAEGHRFEPCRSHLTKYGWIPEWPKGTDCKSAANCFGGSNPSPSICRSGGTGRRPGLKIPWVVIPVPVRSRFAARLRALIHTNRSSFSISIFQPPVPTTSLAAARSVLRDAAARRPSLLASMQYHSR